MRKNAKQVRRERTGEKRRQ